MFSFSAQAQAGDNNISSTFHFDLPIGNNDSLYLLGFGASISYEYEITDHFGANAKLGFHYFFGAINSDGWGNDALLVPIQWGGSYCFLKDHHGPYARLKAGGSILASFNQDNGTASEIHAHPSFAPELGWIFWSGGYFDYSRISLEYQTVFTPNSNLSYLSLNFSFVYSN